MSRQRRRTADDFVRDMKAKQQQRSGPGDVDRKTSEGPEQADAWRGNSSPTAWPIPTSAPSRSRRSAS